MQINSIQTNQNFGTKLAKVGGNTVYSEAQKALLGKIIDDIKVSTFDGIGEIFGLLPADCVILAKPKGKNALTLQALSKDYFSKAKYSNFYDYLDVKGKRLSADIPNNKNYFTKLNDFLTSCYTKLDENSPRRARRIPNAYEIFEYSYRR
ncbi:MAG: hypothetical protein MJ180_05355 [Candidatus Gastranaerophilales bacterium]|nr:hypothetical protein [Candidatus Gastranaerophilales bacterium]